MTSAVRLPARGSFAWRASETTPPAVLALLERLGGRRTEGDDWDVYWTDRISPDAIFAKLDGARLAFGFKGQDWLCNKQGLARTLERARTLASRRVAHDLFDFAPRSFVFPRDFQAWRVRAEDEPGVIWISKVGHIGQGQGVNMVTDVDAVRPDPDLVLQEYIATPHLLGGHKYTLRVYVAITSLDPLRVWVFPDGLAKLTTRPFTTDRASLANRFVHLTNPTVLEHDTTVDLASKRMTHARYRERLRRDGHDDVALFRAIDALVAKTVLAAREPMRAAAADAGLPIDGCFTLFGLDVLVDRDLRPWLIEVNSRPALGVPHGVATDGAREEADVKTRVVVDLLSLVGLCRDHPSAYELIVPSPSMFAWLPAYEEIRACDVADLRAACAKAGLDPRVDVDAVTIERDTPDELVVIHDRHDHRLELNATAALVWRSFARGLSASEAVRAVAQRDGPDDAEDDVWEMLAQLVQLGAWTVRREP